MFRFVSRLSWENEGAGYRRVRLQYALWGSWMLMKRSATFNLAKRGSATYLSQLIVLHSLGCHVALRVIGVSAVCCSNRLEPTSSASLAPNRKSVIKVSPRPQPPGEAQLFGGTQTGSRRKIRNRLVCRLDAVYSSSWAIDMLNSIKCRQCGAQQRRFSRSSAVCRSVDWSSGPPRAPELGRPGEEEEISRSFAADG